jgi:hypothetical protein
MKKFELTLKITVVDDTVKVEIDTPNESLPAAPPFDGPLSITIDATKDTSYSTSSWHGSEEMWYTSYKE